MFFVRAAFWIFLILLLMPTNDKEKLDFYTAAGRTVSDLGSFCDRNPQVCEKTAALFETIIHKMRTAAEILEDMVRSTGPGGNPRERRRDADMQGVSSTGAISSTAAVSQQTLRPDDLQPAWRGPGGI